MESIAVDGVVIEGTSSVNQASITGESLPVSKKPGDLLFAGTLNEQGGLDMRVTKLATESTLAKLIQLVEKAQGQKATTQRFLEKAEQWYALSVILFTAALIVVPIYILHEPFASTFYRAMTVMVVASPCALVISTPASILSAIAAAARRGVLFKGGVYLEKAAAIDTVAFDKPARSPRQTRRHQSPGPSSRRARPRPTSAARRSLALARCRRRGPQRTPHRPRRRRRGQAPLHAHRALHEISVRRRSRRQRRGPSGAASPSATSNISTATNRPSAPPPRGTDEPPSRCGQDRHARRRILGEHDAPTVRYLGFIAVADKVRREAPAMIAKLRELGIKRVVMLTGDGPARRRRRCEGLRRR